VRRRQRLAACGIRRVASDVEVDAAAVAGPGALDVGDGDAHAGSLVSEGRRTDHESWNTSSRPPAPAAVSITVLGGRGTNRGCAANLMMRPLPAPGVSASPEVANVTVTSATRALSRTAVQSGSVVIALP